MRREDLLYRVPNPREALHPLTPFFELVECRLRPTAPVKQGVPVLHDLTQLAPMRQTSGHGQEPLAFARLHMPFDTQRSEEHTSELQSRPHLVWRLLLVNKCAAGRHLV